VEEQRSIPVARPEVPNARVAVVAVGLARASYLYPLQTVDKCRSFLYTMYWETEAERDATESQ